MAATSMRETLAAAGRVGRDLLAVDWPATPLGDPDEWPPSLRGAVRIVLSTRFPMWMAWGPELTFFCNDAYRHDTLGTKYPWALGRPAREVWSEVWSYIEARLVPVMAGESTWDEALQLFLERSGYVEETYHTFSYSPLTDDDGTVRGMLCVVAEVTEQVVNERRMSTLRDLGIRVSTAESVTAAVRAGCDHLAGNDESLPWVAAYLFDADGNATLAGAAGIAPGHAAAPRLIEAGDADPVWPIGALATGAHVTVDGVDERFPDLPTGAWRSPPEKAVLVPLPRPMRTTPYGFLVLGANRHRPVDETFFDFADLIAGHFAAAITDASAMEREKERSEALARMQRRAADAERRTLARELAIADELQHSLLPDVEAHTEALEIATFYRPGVKGTQVGGDWYDVVNLGGGRTGLVIGDVMGRGVRAAAVMGQIKAAVRAFARLDLTPGEVMENLDGIVQDVAPFGIVTCVYGVYDDADRSLSYANAGHLPPILVHPDGSATRLPVDGPPLGSGYVGFETRRVELPVGGLLTVYTDGLLERRGTDLGLRLDALEAALVEHRDAVVAELPGILVRLLAEGASDDVALAVVKVHESGSELMRLSLSENLSAVATSRRAVAAQMRAWRLAGRVVADMVLLTSELVTNALRHARGPYELRLRHAEGEVVVEVGDASARRPRRRRVDGEAESGRGLTIVEAIADQWGSRSIAEGKVVWAARRL